MDIKVTWSKPLEFWWEKTEYTFDWSTMPAGHGVYVIGRQHGKTMEALYVGQALNIAARLSQQLNNLKLMHHVEQAATGKRIILAGTIKLRQKQKIEKCMDIVERALIRYFISEGHELANKNGKPRLKHGIHSDGAHPKRWFPSELEVEV